MKKHITLFTLLLNLSFNQTGIVTPESESVMGVWVEISKGVDCGDSDCKEIFGVEMSYMMENGLEFGVNYNNYDEGELDKEFTAFHFQYHFKHLGKNLKVPIDFIPNFAFGLGKLTKSASNNFAYNEDTDFTLIGCTLYGENLFSFRYLYLNQDDSDNVDEKILFGKIFNLNSFYLKSSYALDIEHGKFSDLLEDLDDGVVSFGIGVTF